MAHKSEVLARIKEVGVVPVLRASSEEQAMRLARAAAAGGVLVMEVTMTVPGALEVIRRLVNEEPQVLVGAGTVLDPETAKACIAEGAEFIVSPAVNLKTIEYCREMDVAVMPGALTPTEIVTAWQAGADVVKIFPAGTMGGAKYLKNLQGPLPQVKVLPSGGVSVETARELLEAGAYALGAGTDLMNEKATDEAVTAKAAAYLKVIREFRGL